MNCVKHVCIVIMAILFCSCVQDKNPFTMSDSDFTGALTGSVGDRIYPFNGVTVTLLPVGRKVKSSGGFGEYMFDKLSANTYYKLHFAFNDYFEITTGDSFYIQAFKINRCPQWIAMRYRFANLAGKVLDGTTNKAVPKAWVQVEHHSGGVTTTANGTFYLSRVNPGLAHVYAGKDSLFGETYINALQDTTLSGITITLNKIASCSITGRVVTGSGQPVAGANVSLVKGVSDTLTNDSGRFVLRRIPEQSNLTFTVSYKSDSIKIFNVCADTKTVFNIGDITVPVIPAKTPFYILPSRVYAARADSIVRLMSPIVITDNSYFIQSYEWDRDNNGAWDTTTQTGFLDYRLDAKGSSTIKVRCASDTFAGVKKYSNTSEVTVNVYSYANRLIHR